MKKAFSIFYIVFIFVSMQVCAYELNWTRIDDNNFVDYDSVVGADDMYGFSFLMKSYNKGQYEPVNGRNILYTLSHYELNCARHTYKIGIMDSYDKNDGFVNGDYNRYSEFQPVVEGSAVSVVAERLCKSK